MSEKLDGSISFWTPDNTSKYEDVMAKAPSPMTIPRGKSPVPDDHYGKSPVPSDQKT